MPIKCTEQYNIKCLVCGNIPPTLTRVGAYHMCPKCFKKVFGESVGSIEPKSVLGDIYYRWLKVYKGEVSYDNKI